MTCMRAQKKYRKDVVMNITYRKINKLSEIVAGLGMFVVIALLPTNKAWASMVPNDKDVSNGYVCEYYNVLQFVENMQMAPGEKTSSSVDYALDLRNASHIKYDLYEAYNYCCPANRGKTTRSYTCSVNGASSISSTNTSDMYLPNVEWNDGVLTIDVELKNGEACPSCGRIMQIKYGISRVRVYRYTPKIKSQPQSMQACEGGSLTYSCQSDYATGYQWQVLSDGSYVNINDGTNSNGSIYSGTGSSNLAVSNVSAKDNGNIYRCVVMGVSNQSLASNDAALSVESVNIPSATPTIVPTIEPTITPTITPTKVPEPIVTATPTPIITPKPTASPKNEPEVTPTPTPEPTRTAEDTPIPTVSPTPKPSVTATPVPTTIVQPTKSPTRVPSKPDNPIPNSPSTSSSSYIIYVPIIPNQPSTSTSSSSYISTDSSSSSSSAIGTIYEDVSEDDEDDYANIIPGGPSTSSKSSTSKSSSGKDKQQADMQTDNKHAGTSYRVNKSDVAKTIMKNGVLYIYDEDDDLDKLSFEDDNEGIVEEEYELENAYTENDLMQKEAIDITKENKALGVGAYIGIGIAFVLVLLLLIFGLFFGVIVEGECEEHDDVFDICGIRWLYRKEGSWCVNLGEVFEENAVVRLRLGLLFVLIFADTELVGYVSGINAGDVCGDISQKMLLYRKRIRRSADE